MDGGGVCAVAAVQTSNSPQHTSAGAMADSERRETTACKDRNMRAPETGDAAIVVCARGVRQACTQRGCGLALLWWWLGA
ncbi:hypothetical protein DZE36_16025 [Xanthomonas campestris pv. campestris]|nr:hypothetical protein DFG55_16320 [Xanthomonas campestris pv. campestris]RFF49774.1 hypothetical protein D0A35_11795 [Xanthomonas campestris]RFF67733.1 hypothetical protein D0A40_09445 [Xanthomonas campestris pv. raphani]QCX73526.1 hypothetical protein DFG54_14100 [Xanthomonas campestris pv. campestris]RFF45297.1 hypothetical protein D0A42_10435 [Xanthomonas campestris pv. campestris]